MEKPVLPEGLEYVRTTALWDEQTVPAGLLRAHHVAEGVWANLIVDRGEVRFVFEDAADSPFTISAGESMPIPPVRKHHVELSGPAAFAVEFYREPAEPVAEPGNESTGLTGGD